MKVYVVVSAGLQSGTSIRYVFSTRGLAEKWIDGLTRQYQIVEMEVDVAEPRENTSIYTGE